MKTDIDIDFVDRNIPLQHLPHIQASMVNRGVTTRHNTGVYFQNIPVNPFNNLASIPYEEAEELGYFKLDFINNTIYQGVRDQAHIDELVAREAAWDLLEDSEFVDMLAHIRDHFDIVNAIKPKSVKDLAIVLALIRPGKRHLLNKSRTEIERDIWVPPTDGTYYFKKAHAFAYALSIKVQMNLIVERALSGTD